MEQTTYERYKFSDVFKENSGGSLTPLHTIKVNGVVFGPNASFQKGVAFGGVDFNLYRNVDIAIKKDEKGILEIHGFYKEL